MDLLREAAVADEALALATVIATSGSTPRHPGARMLVDRQGRGRGTIGGGRVELEVCRAGAEVAAGGAPRRVVHHLVRDLAMCCGGSMELWLEPVGPARAALAAAVACFDARGRGRLIHHLGDGRLEFEAGPAPRRAGLDGDRFVEPIAPRERAILFGAGHVTRALGPVLAGLGFEVVVCDDGETGALDAAPPWAARTIDSFERTDVERALGGLGAADAVLILTRDHAIDQRILEQWLPHDGLGYVGLIGSRRKVEMFRQRLAAKGIADGERWARLRAPIGLDLGAETPAEIAISIAGELIARRAGAAAAGPR